MHIRVLIKGNQGIAQFLHQLWIERIKLFWSIEFDKGNFWLLLFRYFYEFHKISLILCKTKDISY